MTTDGVSFIDTTTDSGVIPVPPVNSTDSPSDVPTRPPRPTLPTQIPQSSATESSTGTTDGDSDAVVVGVSAAGAGAAGVALLGAMKYFKPLGRRPTMAVQTDVEVGDEGYEREVFTEVDESMFG